MPGLELTFKIPEAFVAPAVKALCNRNGVPESNLNARQVAKEILLEAIENQRLREASITKGALE